MKMMIAKLTHCFYYYDDDLMNIYEIVQDNIDFVVTIHNLFFHLPKNILKKRRNICTFIQYNNYSIKICRYYFIHQR